MTLGVHFDEVAQAQAVANNRMDVACFVGLVRARGRELPSWLSAWFVARGFAQAPGAHSAAELRTLAQVPVPISSFETFDALYDWQNAADGVTYLGAAVRAFFAQGGRKCFVVRAGDPPALGAAGELRRTALAQIVPRDTASSSLSPHEPAAWRGIGHLHGLSEAAMLCVPDLPLLLAQVQDEPKPDPETEHPPEYFVDCTVPPVQPPLPPGADKLQAPRLIDAEGYRAWAEELRRILQFVQRFRRDVQLIAALPLSDRELTQANDLLAWLLSLDLLRTLDAGGLASAHLQLCYPWLHTQEPSGLPEELEPPDAAVAGTIARNTLSRGAFMSAAGQALDQLRGVYPELSQAQRERLHPLSRPGEEARLALQQRVSVVARTVDGFELLSDNTLSADAAFRPANSNRLMSVWVRALAQLGDRFVFEASNERLWDQVVAAVRFVGESLFRQGALRGDGAEQAFEVRCDASTMSRSDIDNGRVIAEVSYRPAMPIEGVRVAFMLQNARPVALVMEQAV